MFSPPARLSSAPPVLCHGDFWWLYANGRPEPEIGRVYIGQDGIPWFQLLTTVRLVPRSALVLLSRAEPASAMVSLEEPVA